MELKKTIKSIIGAENVKWINAKRADLNLKRLTLSLEKAAEEQGLSDLVKKLKIIVPDVSEKETGFKLEGPFWTLKVYILYAFQMKLLLKTISLLESSKEIVYADVGDSCGNHTLFLKGLLPGKKIKTVSINIDPVAIEKIKAKELEAIQIPVERIESIGLHANIIASFQMLEHLHDPSTFMYKISNQTRCDYMLITVPYQKQSRTGMHYIRHKKKGSYLAQDVHIFELSPEDWILLFKHSGWKCVYQETYLQYPQKHYYRFLKKKWREFDFEGFWGVILERDPTWAGCYTDWQEISSLPDSPTERK